MVGYRNERYRYFGWASARLDDAANLLPARLTALLAILAGRRGPAAVSRCWQDRSLHASPNAGLVEAAFAQALRLKLGGGAVYGGSYVQRQPVGAEFPPPERRDIGRAMALSDRVGTLAVLSGLSILALRASRNGAEPSPRRGSSA
jgi:adenosylcobinamide-phosphate synthase